MSRTCFVYRGFCVFLLYSSHEISVNMKTSVLMRVSSAQWPDLDNHKLNTISNYLNFKFKHHDALDDTLACANALVKIGEEQNLNCPIEIAKKLKIKVPGLRPTVPKSGEKSATLKDQPPLIPNKSGSGEIRNQYFYKSQINDNSNTKSMMLEMQSPAYS